MSWQLVRRLLTEPLRARRLRRLHEAAASWTKPKHVGIILDGNRRFAREHALASVVDGHRRGADKIRQVLDWCLEYGTEIVTIWIFSLENFRRDDEEVSGLFDLIEGKVREMAVDEDIHAKRMKVKFIGRVEALPASLQDAIQIAEAATESYDAYVLNVAIAYAGREEVIDACRGYLQSEQDRGASLARAAKGLNVKALEGHLYTAGQPHPDLLIRTSGELRLSGFLLWQAAYSEYYFCDCLWPAFSRLDLLEALRSYHMRHRRYGS